MTHRWWLQGVFALTMLVAPGTACADSADIEHRCTVRYPSITQYFAWKDCVKTETQEEAEENNRRLTRELKREKDEAARPCIAADISRMEGMAEKVKAAIKPEWGLEEAQTA